MAPAASVSPATATATIVPVTATASVTDTAPPGTSVAMSATASVTSSATTPTLPLDSATAPALPVVSATPPLTTGTDTPVTSTVATLNGAAGVTATQAAYGHLPLSFEPNQGQAGPDGAAVRFLSHGPGYTLFLTGTDATLTLRQPRPHHRSAHAHGHDLLGTDALTQTAPVSESVVRLRYEGANPHPQVVGEDQLPGMVNYFIGNDPSQYHTDIPTYARVAYKSVYPGVDLVYYGKQGQLEYDWQVAPGADPSAVAFKVDGAQGLSLDGHGNLLLQTGVGRLEQRAPLVYQEINGQRHAVAAEYTVDGAANTVRFAIGAYDTSKPLVIDPVLSYSTYLGGSGVDKGFDIKVDAAGNAYVTGKTGSSTFVTTPNPLQGADAGGIDAFVTKLNASGTVVLYSTYLGGNGTDDGNAIAVDAAGDAYVAGGTESLTFPIVNGVQATCGGCRTNSTATDAFMAELNPSGSALQYSTYLGGTQGSGGYSSSQANGIALDGSGKVYLTGWTEATNFLSKNAFQSVYGGGSDDIFVTKIDPTAAGSASLLYSTYLGGNGDDEGNPIAVDGSGNAYVTGETSSTNFPTVSPLQASYGGSYDAFVVKVSAGSNTLAYSTYLGGSGTDDGVGIAVDVAGNAIITGLTASTDFPTFPGTPLQRSYNGGSYDAFVTKIDGAASGSAPWHPHRGVRMSDGLGASVDLADGHIDVNASDLSIPGRGPSLALNHTWDSTLAQGYITTTAGQGWSTNLTRSMGGLLTATVTYTDQTGMTWPFTYSGSLTPTAGLYTAYNAPPGQPWQLAASTAGYTLTNFLSGAVTRFDATGRYLSDTDSYGNSNAVSSLSGGVQTWSNSGGRALRLSSYASGLLSDAQSPLWQSSGGAQGQHVTYGYGGPGGNQLTTLTRGAGTTDAVTATFGYSGPQLVTVMTPAGRTWTTGYDPFGRVTSVTSPVSGTAGQPGYTPAYTTQITYGATQTQVIAGYGASGALTTTYTLDGQGEATGVTDGLGHSSRSSYDAAHDVTSSTDANGHTTTYGYQYVGPSGNVGLITQTVAPSVTLYSPLNPVSTTIVTTRTYDPTTYDLVEADKPAGGVTRYGYDGHHGVITTTELITGGATPQWRGTVAAYDPYGEQTAVTDGRGVSVTAGGVASLTSQASSYTRRTSYDGQGDAVASYAAPITTTLNGYTGTLPVVTLDAYDADGNRTAATSANRASTLYGYDHLGRQVQTTAPSVGLYNAPLIVTPTIALNSGGGTAGTFSADTNYSGGATYGTGAAIDTSGVVNPAPQSVYQSERYGNFSYTVPTLTPGAAYRVRLHVAEIFFSVPGQRVFSVAVNGTPVLTNFDIIAVAGAPNRAIVEEFTANADSGGQLTVQYTTVVDNAKISGIEVIPTTAIRERTSYDRDGNVVSTTDANGATTTSSYDPLGRQVSTTNPVSGTTTTTYNATEQVSAQDAQGHTTSSGYDAAGRLVQSSDALTGTAQYAYDAAGATVAITSGDTSGAVTQVETQVYDALNRVITATVSGPGGTPQSTATYYDKDGNVYQTVQPSGGASVNTYDLADQLRASETDGAPVLAATHQNQTVYSYDLAGNVVETVDPDGRDTTTAYDGDSRATSSVATSVGVSGTTTLTTTLQYDPNGNTLAQTVQTRDPSGAVQTFTNTSTYDAADRETSATDNGLTTGYGYDAAGQQRTETVQNGASTVTRTLDPQGRETALAEGGYTSSFAYNSNDLITAITLPGGVSESAQYDANNRLTTWHDPGPGQNVTYAYGYDAVSRVTSMTAASGTDTLAYDAQSRLVSDCGPQVIIKGGDGCYRYSYDRDGNLLTALDDQVGVTDLYTYTNPLQPDRQTAGGSTTSPATATIAFAYDGSGNTTSISNPVALTNPSSKDARNDRFGYDAQGRVTRVTRLVTNKDGSVTPLTATLQYNAQGQRSEYLLTPAPGEGNPVDTRFAYRDGELAQAAVTGVGLTPYTNTFVYRQDGSPYQVIRTDPTGTNRYWYETDGRGDVVAVTSITGTVVDRYSYDQWGEPITDDRTNEMVPQQLRYKGLYYDEALTYYWAGGRYYDPEAMRYLQPASPDARSYIYASGNPVGTLLGQRSGLRPHISPTAASVPYVDPCPNFQPAPGAIIYSQLDHTYIPNSGVKAKVRAFGACATFSRATLHPVPNSIPEYGPQSVPKINSGYNCTKP